MANSISHSALPYPIKGARFSLEIAYRTSAGTPTDPTTPDTEVSSDGGATSADCTEEATTGSTNGAAYITLTSTETNNSAIWVIAKSANCVTTVIPLYPRVLATVGTGTLSAGSAAGGTLGTLLAYDVTGCFIKTTGGTGGASGSFQARKIITYNTTTGAFTVEPNWETTPDNTTTYSVLLPEGVTLGMLKTLNPTTAGNTLDVTSTGEAGLDWANMAGKTTTNALTGTTIAVTQKVDVETIKTNPVANAGTVTFPTNATLASTTNITAGTITTVTTVTNQLTAAAIATGIWQDTTSGDFTVSSSIGKSLYTTGNAPGAASGLSIVGSAMTLAANQHVIVDSGTITTYTGNTVQTGDAFARLGAPVGASHSADVAAVKSDTGGLVTTVGVAGLGLSAIPKTGYKLASDGLDSIAVTAPSTVATTFPGMVVQLWRRMFKKTVLNSNTGKIITYADDGTTAVTTQDATDSGGVQTQGTST